MTMLLCGAALTLLGLPGALWLESFIAHARGPRL